MKYILTSSNLYLSARDLTRIIEEITKVRLGITTIPDKDFIIRWGTSTGRRIQDTNYNNPELISIAGNKKRFSDFLSDHGAPCVEFSTSIPEEFPVVCRKTLNGSGGEGISICKSIEEFREGNFPYQAWSPWYNFSPNSTNFFISSILV